MPQRILVVDDEADLLRLIEYSLEKNGFEVLKAVNGAQALSLIKSTPPDLVILDVMLPDMSGVEICGKLRTEMQLGNLPVIMLSARAQVADKIAGISAGADEYVVKPVDLTELVARVRGLLQRTQTLIKARESSRGRLIGVIGARGGIGATTITLGVATALLATGRSVIAAELRADSGSFAIQLGVKPQGTTSELFGPKYVPPLDKKQLSRQLTTLRFGLRALFGPQALDEYRPVSEDNARELLDVLTGMADYVVVDLPFQVCVSSQIAAQLCNAMLVVLEPVPSCMLSAKSTLAVLGSWGVGEQSAALVITHRTIAPMSFSAKEVTAQLQCRTAGILPHDPEALSKALAVGVPAAQSQPGSSAAFGFATIATFLTSEIAGTSGPSPSTGPVPVAPLSIYRRLSKSPS